MMKREGVPTERLIHLVDHDTASLLLLFEELTRAGFHVNASSVSRKALDFIRERKPDIVVCNLHMPGIDGLELLAEVKRCSPETRVIFLSSCGDWAVYEEIRRRGAFDLLPKPVTGKVLRRILGRLLEDQEAGSSRPSSIN